MGWLLLATIPALAVCALPSTASAKVEVKVRADGTRVIVDETPAQRAVRTAGRLQPLTTNSSMTELIRQHARQQGLSPRLVQSVVQVESGYNPKALSNKGAQGLMQLMPATARELGVDDAFDPGQNLRGGTLYLRRQLDRFGGDLTLALAAYNAGPGAVERHDGVPPYRETRHYVQKVLSLYRGAVPQVLQEQAREHARLLRRAKAKEDKLEQAASGEKVYLRRGKNNRILFTTAAPKPD
jgi:soluble lytic murein transglycosylase-like protein